MPNTSTEHSVGANPVRITPILQQAYDYWNTKRGTRTMPSRNDIDPSEIRRLLPHIVLLDVLVPGPGDMPFDLRLRLIGTSVQQHMSFYRQGTLLSKQIPREPDSLAWAKAERVVRTGQPSYDHVPYVGPHRDFLAMCDVALPLSDDGVTVNMLMFAVDFVSREFLGLST